MLIILYLQLYNFFYQKFNNAHQKLQAG